MKRRSSWILPSLAVAALAAAPADARAQSGWGVVAGVNFASLSGDDADDLDLDRRTGFVGGLFGAFPLGQVLTFRPEIVYTQKGASFEEAGFDREVHLDYIEIPVLLRIGVPGVGLGLHALAGPTLSFEVSCSGSTEGAGIDLDIDCGDADDTGRKTFLVGGQVGAGVDLPLGATLLSLDGRYQFDLEDLSETADLAHRVWSVTASVGFPLGM